MPEEEATTIEEAAEEKPAKKTRATSKSSTSTKKESKSSAGKSVDDIISAIRNMTVLELSELVKTLEDEFGVSAAVAAPVAATATMAAPTETTAAAEEKTEFNIILKPDGHILIIDWPQYVKRDHPNADQLLKRDIGNVVRFFQRKHGLKVNPKEAFIYVKGA